eukprot:CAMPEP_0115391528 /NCGR_PEP_ID=MMETSP0271-20121206/10758_1 /TAXON_ID=71861 /ORGANISM="Scrippsiella trochoidea, Strain CCMP3099" /LENGTH=754 /DNA_ID=CAMNT_0002815093 /DNA_START=47 /DNA_END=2311 /DNA_ORIENTATION=+
MERRLALVWFNRLLPLTSRITTWRNSALAPLAFAVVCALLRLLWSYRGRSAGTKRCLLGAVGEASSPRPSLLAAVSASVLAVERLKLKIRRRGKRSITEPPARLQASPSNSASSTIGWSDVGSEPRASECHPPWVMKSRIIRHISFFHEYSIDDRRVLGEGLNGRVYRAVHRRSGRPVAAKCLKASSYPALRRTGSADGQRSLPEELTLYLRMSHPNICRLLEAYIEDNGDAWLCMEYCRGGELFEQVAGTSSVVREDGAVADTEERVAALVRQMAAAFRYLHSMGVVHRDNKLENWVFASPAQQRIKLIDFGFATSMQPDTPRLTHVCGTCYYVAPEVFRVRRGKLMEGSGYGAEVDIWALGVILYMLISGRAPFVAESEKDILWEIAAPKINARLRASPFSGRRWRNVSRECQDLISRCLERDPRKRISAADVQAHPWLNRSEEDGWQADALATSALSELLHAGTKLVRSRILAYICGHMSQRMYLGPELWSELKDVFFSLEGANMRTPRGVVHLDDLATECLDKCDLGAIRALCDTADAEQQPLPEDDGQLCRELLASLDLTGDGRLHFYEVIGAMIAAGRVEVREHDVDNAFAAFDVDRDGTVSIDDMAAIGGSAATHDLRNQEAGCLSLPISDPGTILRCLQGDDMVMPLSPALSAVSLPLLRQESDPLSARSLRRRLTSPATSEASSPLSRKGTQRFLSKCESQLPWEVERRFAFENRRDGFAKGSPSILRQGRHSSPTIFQLGGQAA